ncbi:MAG: SAVED domain-containing protein [Methanothrix sp.]
MDLFDLLGKFANIVQLIMFCVFVWATVTLLIARKRIERKLNLLEKDEKSVRSKRRIAIVIGVGKNPLASVEKFLADNNLADIPIINWISDGFLQAGDYTAAMAEINDLRSQALKLGVSEVLLFYAGPIDLAMFIGASFSDWVPIRVYAFTDTGTYQHRVTVGREAARLCTMTDELVKGLEGKL